MPDILKTAMHQLNVPICALGTVGGPKIKRSLTTDWHAHRVDDRFKRCLNPR